MRNRKTLQAGPGGGIRRALRRWASRLAFAAITAALAACTPPPPAAGNAFLGTWANAQNNRITFRPETVVQLSSAEGPGKPFDKSTCGGVFRFAYTTRSRKALTALVPYQPRLRQKLDFLLKRPRYRVAELACDRGDQTYVLLDERQILAIYRDGDIGAIERLGRR